MVNVDSIVPDWLNAENFTDLLRNVIPSFDKIINFSARSAMPPGENYSTIMIRANVDVALKNGTTETQTYMIKVAHDNELVRQMLERINMFHIESNTLRNLLPKFEDMYKTAGVSVHFGPTAYILPKCADGNYVLMGDLAKEGYVGASRTECLDIAHIHLVLKKLAQYHAASATYKEKHGPFSDDYTKGLHKDDTHRVMWIKIMQSFKDGFMKNVKLYHDGGKYAPAVAKYFETLDAQYSTLFGYDDVDGFNVLSHGDCWTSNMLFKYANNGTVEDVRFVDFQLPSWCSPIKDILYFILTSAKNDIKLKNFDYYLRYYHDHLIASLKILEYTKEIPTLRWLHSQSYKYGGWATSASMLTLPIVLYDSSKESSLDNLIGGDDAGVDFKAKLFANPNYIKHFNDIMPWLYNQGFFNDI